LKLKLKAHEKYCFTSKYRLPILEFEIKLFSQQLIGQRQWAEMARVQVQLALRDYVKSAV
jgi:hypothetical protein